LSSCISIQKNYVGGKLKDNCRPDKTQYSLSDTEREDINRNVDSLLSVITLHKNLKKPIRAAEINQLYSDFGRLLDHDRFYDSILHKNLIVNYNQRCSQTFAVAKLLSSAMSYNSIFQKNRTIRRAINMGESGNNIPKRVLQKSNNFLYSPSVRRKISNQCREKYCLQTDSILHLLPKTNMFKALYYRVYRHNDRYHCLIRDICHLGSYLVGNGVGFFHGSTDRKTNAKLLLPYLQPYDIILLRSPHHLTEKLIPGYFGHSAIWLGPELTKPLISVDKQNNDKQISDISMKSAIEVLRTGVKISSLEEFADGEDFLVLRLKDLSLTQKQNILINIRKQLKKAYDFNFDIESPAAVSCTELVFLAYDFVDWQVRYTWFRYTISPIDLGLTALKNHNFEFPAFIRNSCVLINPDRPFIGSIIGFPDETDNP